MNKTICSAMSMISTAVWVVKGYLRKLGCVNISHSSPVISSAGGNFESVNGVLAMSLDSSLRCAPFRMTGWGWLCSE